MGCASEVWKPVAIDDVAVDFPDLPILSWRILRFPVSTKPFFIHVPAQAEWYIDLSGWSPKYFAPQLIQSLDPLLKHKVLFGSDYPLLTPDRWMADLEKTAIKEEVRPLILKQNACKLLGIG